jgi:hypothetical protein
MDRLMPRGHVRFLTIAFDDTYKVKYNAFVSAQSMGTQTIPGLWGLESYIACANAAPRRGSAATEVPEIWRERDAHTMNCT